MQTSPKIAISILAVAIIVLGYLIYSNRELSVYPNPQNNTVNTPTTSNGSQTAESRESALARLKATQDLVAENPWPDTTKMKEYSAKVERLAVDSEVVELNYCAPNPGVLHLKVGQSFTLRNSDSVFHRLNDAKYNFEAAANSEQKITPNFPAGMYFLRCGEPFGLIVWVTP